MDSVISESCAKVFCISLEASRRFTIVSEKRSSLRATTWSSRTLSSRMLRTMSRTCASPSSPARTWFRELVTPLTSSAIRARLLSRRSTSAVRSARCICSPFWRYPIPFVPGVSSMYLSPRIPCVFTEAMTSFSICTSDRMRRVTTAFPSRRLILSTRPTSTPAT